jgi:hypothetical protein
LALLKSVWLDFVEAGVSPAKREAPKAFGATTEILLPGTLPPEPNGF